MSKLSAIATGALTGTAPTPVVQRAINNYLVHDELMFLMEFVNIGMSTNLGNLQANYIYYDGESAEADFRRIGNEYSVDNEVPKTGTVVLKLLGGSFEVDKVQTRAFNTSKQALSNWTEQQFNQKLNKIRNGFSKYFIIGNATTNPLQFDGLDVHFGKFPKQVETEAYDLSKGLNDATVIAFERYLNESINKVKPNKPNVIITTDTGKAILQAINSFRHRGIAVVKVEDREFDAFGGIPIVALPRTYFASADVTDKDPIIFGSIAELDGIATAIPIDGELIDITLPEMGNGTLVKTGAVEVVLAPMFLNPRCVAKCYVTEVAPV